MKFYRFINEALKPSQFRPLMKVKRDKHLWDDIFGDKQRIYIPFSKEVSLSSNFSEEQLERFKEVRRVLSDNKFSLIDWDNAPDGASMHELKLDSYKKGICYKGNTQYKIGKVLNKIAPDLLQKFNNDKIRQGKNTDNHTEIVISRHPYDIGGMSTDRGWTSCQNLKGGAYCQYVPEAVKANACVAYLTYKNDKNINHPIARILLVPHKDEISKKIFLVPTKVYGTNVEGFKESLEKFIEEKQGKPGKRFILQHAKNMYNDNSNAIITNVSNIDSYKIKHDMFDNASQIVSFFIHLADNKEIDIDYLQSKFAIKKIQSIINSKKLSDEKKKMYIEAKEKIEKLIKFEEKRLEEVVIDKNITDEKLDVTYDFLQSGSDYLEDYEKDKLLHFTIEKSPELMEKIVKHLQKSKRKSNLNIFFLHKFLPELKERPLENNPYFSILKNVLSNNRNASGQILFDYGTVENFLGKQGMGLSQKESDKLINPYKIYSFRQGEVHITGPKKEFLFKLSNEIKKQKNEKLRIETHLGTLDLVKNSSFYETMMKQVIGPIDRLIHNMTFEINKFKTKNKAWDDDVPF